MLPSPFPKLILMINSKMRGTSGASPSPIEPRHRLLAATTEDASKVSSHSLKGKVIRDVERPFLNPSQDRTSSCKFPTSILVLVVFVFVAIFTLLHSPAVYNTEHTSDFESRFVQIEERSAADQRYVSLLEVNWAQISKVIEKLTDTKEYQGIGLLNFNDSEVYQWKKLLPNAEHISLHLDYVAKNVTWETLYPEWIDEEEQFKVPFCPTLPKLQHHGKPRIDLVAVKLPCKNSTDWSRDLARLHLQLAAAGLAATVKGNHPMRILLVTECFPIPNIFTCKELLVREGQAWLYEPNLNTLREKVQLPIGSCELAVPLKAKEKWSSGNEKREAYATILHSAHHYVCGAIAAAQSIRMVGSTRDLVILVDDTISEYHREGLEAAGWKIHTIRRIRNPKAEQDAYNEWNYSKFRLWQLTDYDKIIFIDADLLILRSIDFLFEMPEITATANDVTLFNSGVMVIEPSNCTFQLLMDHVNEIKSYNGGDQGYLNEIFTWWHRIPKQMNFLKHFWEGDEEEVKDMKTQLFSADPPVLYVVHYLGLKPWLCFRDYDCNWNVPKLHEFASDAAHRRWWKVHDAMPENLHKYCLLSSELKAAREWDRREAEKGNNSDDHWKIKIQDSRLQTCLEDFCSWEDMLLHWGETNWTDDPVPVATPTLPTAAPVSPAITTFHSTTPKRKRKAFHHPKSHKPKREVPV